MSHRASRSCRSSRLRTPSSASEIRFVGINPSADSPETNVEFAAERGVTYELLRDPDGAFTDAVGITRSRSPCSWMLRRNIVRQTGELDGDELRAHAAELLG